MKFLYSKFTKAFAEVLLTIFLVILAIGGIAINAMYSNDIIGGTYEFRNTLAARNMAKECGDDLSYRISSMYLEDFGEETVYYEKYYDDETDEYVDCYTVEGFDSDKLVIEALENEKFVERILEQEEGINVNYHFVVRTDSEILFTDIEDMSTVELVNKTVHYYSVEYDEPLVYIENYINKEIVKGDMFYEYSFFYDKFANNFWNIVILLVVFIGIAIILGVYIVVSAGYKEDGTLGAGWMDNIPIELYILLFCIVTAILSEVTTFFFRTMVYFIAIIVFAVWLWIIISIIKTSVSRLKNRIFLRKSIIGVLILFFIKLLKRTFVDINTKLKAVFCIGTVMLCEVVAVLAGMATEGALLFVWCLMKIAQFVLLLYIYSMVSKLRNGAKKMHDGGTDIKIDTNDMHGIVRECAEYMNDIFAGLDKAVAEQLKSEQLKTELITNVSHDIKTPLTSIINYVDLMKKEEIHNPKVSEYLDIVDKQSLRLKKLTEDVIEASKAATGNIKAELVKINVSEMIAQALGEYESKFKEINLTTVFEFGDVAHYASADGKLLWRIIDNLFSNVCKYTLERTRLYINIKEEGENVIVVIKNISKYQLNISSEELMQRFVRGDSSRSTSGNGLGLSIAESLAKLQGGNLAVDINGDLFVVNIFLVKDNAEENIQEESEVKVNLEKNTENMDKNMDI